MYDAIVIGGGAAGLAAATWLGRYRRSVLLMDAGESRNRWVEQAHGYLGLDPCDPRALLEHAREDMAAYKTVSFEDARVTAVERRAPAQFVVTANGASFEARRLVLATGAADVFPEVDRFFEHYGCDVFHCPACDGYDALGRDVVVFGWDEHVVGFAMQLFNWARTVTVVTDGRHFRGDAAHRQRLADAGVPLLEDDAVRLEGERGDLRGVRLRGGSFIPCHLAFFTIAHRPINEFARALGCALNDEGYVVVDLHGRTSVDGVYAAGDLTPGLQLLQVAAAKGTSAGVACALSLGDEV